MQPCLPELPQAKNVRGASYCKVCEEHWMCKRCQKPYLQGERTCEFLSHGPLAQSEETGILFCQKCNQRWNTPGCTNVVGKHVPACEHYPGWKYAPYMHFVDDVFADDKRTRF